MDQGEVMTLEQMRQGLAALATKVDQTAMHSTSVGTSVAYNADLLNALIGRVNTAEAAMSLVTPELARMQAEVIGVSSQFSGFGTRVEEVLKVVSANDVAADTKLRNEIDKAMTRVDSG